MNFFNTYNDDKTCIGKKCFIIAEIGQNHQGCLKTAKEMIKKAKESGADCVKFQKSNLEAKFTQKALRQPYESANSFGKTYGEHKKYLEFTLDEYKELISCAKENEILFSASAMDEESYKDLRKLELPFIKIGSGDNNNWIMLEKIAEDEKMPLILSLGMMKADEVMKIQEIFKNRTNIGILHCVSSYPTKSEDVFLRFIEVFQNLFPKKVVGYSGHEKTPIVVSLGAAVMGAKIIERHFTLDKTLKGSDHSCSLDPKELSLLVKLIRKVEQKQLPESKDTESILEFTKNVILEAKEEHLLKDMEELRAALSKNVTLEDKKVFDCEMNCYNKLRKTLVYSRDIPAGKILQKSDFCIKVNTEFGVLTEKIDELIGKILVKNVSYEDSVQLSDFKS
ncbi:sialic acid synthase [Culicoides brevitarsis]|uniref:sialic acid synthase n=1 Tax=Culicoides brevitarsis TaxID=469753 RepID=UPI00307B52B7